MQMSDELVETVAKSLYEQTLYVDNAMGDDIPEWEDLVNVVQSIYLWRAKDLLRMILPSLYQEAADDWRQYLKDMIGTGRVAPVPVWLETRGKDES